MLTSKLIASFRSAFAPIVRLSLLVSIFSLTGCFAILDFNQEAKVDSARSRLLAYEQSLPGPLSQAQGEPLQKLPPPKLEVNYEVRKELNGFLGKNSGFFAASLKRRYELYPVMRDIFEDEGVPHEILNLALIESGYRQEAKSHAGAVGIWQFMKSTGRRYGLNVGLLRDDRKDPILSTIAAARHLRDLYENYGDWHLAIAAYNAGCGTIDRAIARTGKNDFWKLAKSGRIRRETANYVPRFIAATIIVNILGDKAFDAEKSDLVELAQQLDTNEKFASWSGNRRSSAS